MDHDWTCTVECDCGKVIVYGYHDEMERWTEDYEGSSYRYYAVVCPVCGEEVKTSS